MVYLFIAQPYPHACVYACVRWGLHHTGADPAASVQPKSPSPQARLASVRATWNSCWVSDSSVERANQIEYSHPQIESKNKLKFRLQCVGNHCSSADSCANFQQPGNSSLSVCRARDAGRFQGCIWEGCKKLKPRNFGAIGWDSFSLGTYSRAPVKLLPHNAVITLRGTFPISPPQCSRPGRLGVVKINKAEGRAGRRLTPC